MPSDGEIQVVDARVAVPKTHKAIEKAIGLTAADKWIKRAGAEKLKAIKLRARAKVGQFIEQEGEHHIARTILANTYEELQEHKVTCEQMLAEAKNEKNDDKYEKWMRLLLIVLGEMNTSAKNLNLTRRKGDPNNEPSATRVPTMPARTEITNNTQIVVQQPKAQ